MPDDDKKDSVKVAVRLRPLSKKELGNNETSIIELEENAEPNTSGSVKISDPSEKDQPSTYAFDLVYGTDVLQETVFDTVGKPALEKTMTGYNGTIFAYGQTGSGKSWSMTGGGGELRGIIPRVNEQLFVRIGQEQEAISTRRFLVMCSFFEIYNEIIFDLLNPCQDRSKLGAGLQVKEHPVLGIYVKDLQEIVVTDSDKLEKLMESGTKNRAVSSTLMNSVSSRSHSIFTIKVHQKDDEDKSRNVFAKLNLVDLAGSERQKGTGASGQTLKEGANINKSLSALGNVINALVENAGGKKVFVPFRNSKLTRVLQESLGGNSLCTMLAALSPAACNYEETVSTLRYANRAKSIVVSATKNEEASQISRLNAEIEELKKKLAGAADGGGGGGGGGGHLAEEERREMKTKFESQLAEMQHMVSGTWEEKTRLSAEQEAQLGKALEEQRRHAHAMQEECKKRFRLLKDQNDLTLTIRGLVDSMHSLPEVAGPPSEWRSGALPQQWLKTVEAMSEGLDALKQQQTMALVFHGAFSEDVQLWVDCEEASDHATARTGARRALAKVETLRRECEKLNILLSQCRGRMQEFAAAVREALQEWSSTGHPAVLAALREADGSEGAQPEGSLPPLYTQTLEDVGRIMKLVEEQAEGKAEELNAFAAFGLGTAADLVLRGSSLVPDAAAQGQDADLLRSLASGGEAPPQPDGAPAAAAAAAGPAAAGGAPREARPLHEWGPEDVDDTVEGTEAALVQVVKLDTLNKKRTAQELLARPPPKFVHDVACLVTATTSYMPTMSMEWPDPREAKLDLLQQISDAVASSLGLQAIDFDPENVLKGKEVPQTLRLLQLLALAAARHKEQPATAALAAAGSAGKAQREQKRADAKATPASEMPGVLEAFARCIQRVVEQQASRQADGGHLSPTHELETKHRALQERMKEEAQNRQKREEQLGRLQQEVLAARAVLSERSVQLEAVRQAAVDGDARKLELRQKLESLRGELLQRAAEIQGNPEVDALREDFQRLSEDYNGKSAAKSNLAKEVKRLREQQLEADTQRETAELEVRRFKLRLAEGLGGPPPSEEILVLQAEKQKWDMRVQALEDKMRAIVEVHDGESARETELLEEKRLQSSKFDEVQMQLQVIIEERDGLREGMDLLWQEKTRLDEELENVSQGYTHLSDRYAEKIEESRELEEQLRTYEELSSMLQNNFANSQQISSAVGAPPAASAVDTGDATKTAGGPPRTADEDDESNYSADFEDPEEDEDGDDE